MALTKRVIDAAIYQGDGKSRCVIWDEVISGFGVRIFPKVGDKPSRKSFILSYRFNGRKRLMSLGTFGSMTLDKAKEDARRYLVKIRDGIDPLEMIQDKRKSETVKELCEHYIERYAKPKKRSWETDAQRINRYLLPKWGNLKAANIRHSDVAHLHSKIGTKYPYEANRVVALISKMFNLASQWGFLPDGMKNPAFGIESYKEKKRDRWITPEELPKLAKAIDNESNLYAKQALWLYLLTGARKAEILRAEWQHVDWHRQELKIPETKADRTHYIPLSQAALEVLRNTPILEGNPYIIPGLKEGHHLVNIDKPWRRVRKEAEVEDVRLHDLRRTVGSWLAQSGNSLHLIGRVLNHSSQSTTAVYARFGENHVRTALEDHGKKLLGLAGLGETAEVIALSATQKHIKA